MNASINRINQMLGTMSDKVLKEFSNSVVKIGDTYMVFGVYHITENDNGFSIIKNGDEVCTTGYLPTALTWCVFDRDNKIMQNRLMLNADHAMTNRLFDIENWVAMIKSNEVDNETKMAIEMRISNDMCRYEDARHQLQNYIKDAKYIK